MRSLFVFCLMMLFSLPVFASDMDDSFGVRKIDGNQAILEGKVKSLKAGDMLYFVRPPYQFKVKSVDAGANQVIVELPEGSDLHDGNALLRNPTPQIKNFIDTESRLKDALSD